MHTEKETAFISLCFSLFSLTLFPQGHGTLKVTLGPYKKCEFSNNAFLWVFMIQLKSPPGHSTENPLYKNVVTERGEAETKETKMVSVAHI